MKRFVCAAWLLAAACGVGYGQAGGSSMSSLFQPALKNIGQTLPTLQPDRWKLQGPMKQQVAADLSSIQRDTTGTLPGLLSAADATPNSLSAGLAVSANVNALYDVLLRVAEKAQLTAPDNQTMALGQALQSLEDARKTLGTALAEAAVTQDKQVRDLRANLQTQTAAANTAQTQLASLKSAPAPVCAPTKTTVKKKPAAKPAATPSTAAKPAATTPTTK